MQTKCSSMPFSIKQSDQLKCIQEFVKLHKLQAKCEDFKRTLENLITEKAECLSKRETLVEYLSSLSKELRIARNEEINWELKLESANSSFVNNENDSLENICLLLGYRVSEYIPLDDNGLQVTLSYLDICYLTYSETFKIFNLKEVYPQHPNFSVIQLFLKNSQDLKGLLLCLRKFFDYAIKMRQEQK